MPGMMGGMPLVTPDMLKKKTSTKRGVKQENGEDQEEKVGIFLRFVFKFNFLISKLDHLPFVALPFRIVVWKFIKFLLIHVYRKIITKKIQKMLQMKKMRRLNLRLHGGNLQVCSAFCKHVLFYHMNGEYCVILLLVLSLNMNSP